MSNKPLNRIREVLGESGHSQKWLSDQLNIKSRAYVNDLCNNRNNPSLKRLDQIATILKVPAYTLIADYSPESERKEKALALLSEFVDAPTLAEIRERIGARSMLSTYIQEEE